MCKIKNLIKCLENFLGYSLLGDVHGIANSHFAALYDTQHQTHHGGVLVHLLLLSRIRLTESARVTRIVNEKTALYHLNLKRSSMDIS